MNAKEEAETLARRVIVPALVFADTEEHIDDARRRATPIILEVLEARDKIIAECVGVLRTASEYPCGIHPYLDLVSGNASDLLQSLKEKGYS